MAYQQNPQQGAFMSLTGKRYEFCIIISIASEIQCILKWMQDFVSTVRVKKKMKNIKEG
jgi:hypothetical protein